LAGEGLAKSLQKAWAPNNAEAKRLLNAVLILYADHELNTSAFTARCVASTGSTPYAVVASAIGALQGYRHGGASEHVEAMFKEMDGDPDVSGVITHRLKRGEKIPGFGHVIYRDVDPRGRVLIQTLNEVYPDHPAVLLTNQVIEEGHRLLSVAYNVDLGLATLARVLELPPGSTVALFALGRTIGWIGHALEQYREKAIIRPRAKYVGEQPTRLGQE
jgi:citrate synthase